MMVPPQLKVMYDEKTIEGPHYMDAHEKMKCHDIQAVNDINDSWYLIGITPG